MQPDIHANKPQDRRTKMKRQEMSLRRKPEHLIYTAIPTSEQLNGVTTSLEEYGSYSAWTASAMCILPVRLVGNPMNQKNIRSLFCCLALILCMSACTKSTPSNNPVPNPGPDSLQPSSPPQPDNLRPGLYYILYNPANHAKLVQYYEYNASSQLAAIHSCNYDTSFVYNGAVADSFTITLNLSGTQAPPSSYDIVFQYHFSPAGGTREHHLLQYDAQNRITLDSISDGTNSTVKSRFHFIYGNGENVTVSHINLNSVFSDTGQVVSVDTLNIDTENVSYWLNYKNISGGSTEYDFTPSSFSNPVYFESLSKSMALTFLVHGYGDLRSKNLPGEKLLFDIINNITSDSHFTWMTDSTGRVVSGTTRSGPTGPIVEYTYYTYIKN
jgi:hypothetical protein